MRLTILSAFARIAMLGICVSCTESAPTPTVETGTAPVSGGNLYYEIKGSGRNVVLLQGGQLPLAMWDEQFESFSRDFRVVRFDARGFGRSTAKSGPYASEDDLLELLRYLKVDKASLVGLSLGGRVALDFALVHPDVVDRMVVVGPGLSGFDWSDAREPWVDSATAAFQRKDSVRIALLWLESGYMKPAMRDSQLAQRIRDLTARNASLWMQPDSERVLTPPAVSRLRDIRAPTLILLGALDVPDIHRIVDTLSRTIPNSRRVVIDNVGHMVNMEAPADFNRLVLEFLRAR
jgi:3-oxoadipate enol-lactonase